MDKQSAAETLLTTLRTLSMDRVDERCAYSILLDSLLIVAEEGWVDPSLVQQILQELVAGSARLAAFNLRLDIRRLEAAKQLAKNYQLEALVFELTRAVSQSYRNESEWPLAHVHEVLPPVSISTIAQWYTTKTTQLALDQESLRQAKQSEQLLLATQTINEVEQSYRTSLEQAFLGFQIEQMRRRCNQARCKEGREAFEQAFSKVQQLAKRLMQYGHWVHAIALYHSILSDYLTKANILEAQGFDQSKVVHALIEVVTQRQMIKPEPLSPYWQTYQQDLRTLRNKLPSDPQPQDICTVLASLTEDYRQLLAKMLADIENVLGPAPCAFAIMGFGSYSRDGMLPYSDVEFALLLDQNEASHTPYWQALMQLFDFKVLSLGEKTQKPYPGFYIDDLMPLREKGLWGTPEQVVKWVFNPEVPRDESGIDKVNFSVLPVKYLYGNETLVKQYQTLINNQLAISFEDNNVSLSAGQIWALARLKQNITETSVTILMQEKNSKNSFSSIKDIYLGPLTYLVQCLCVYYGAQDFSKVPARLSDKINFIAEKTKLPKDFVTLCQQLIFEVSALRLKVQQHYQGHHEGVIWPDYLNTHDVNKKVQEKINPYRLSNLEVCLLKTLVKTILMPLVSYLKSQLEANNHLPASLDPWADYRTIWQGNEIASPILKSPKLIARLKSMWRHQAAEKQITLDLSKAKEAIAILVYQLTFQKAPVSLYRIYYLQMAATLRAMYLYYLQEQATANPDVLRILETLPESDGIRPINLRRQRTWYKTLKACVEENRDETTLMEAKKAGRLLMICLDLDNPSSNKIAQYVVKKEFAQQLLANANWKEKPAAQAGRHTVLPIHLANSNTPNLWCKLYPEQPGTEYLVSLLAERLSAEGTPNNLLVKLEINNQTVAVQLTEHIAGDNLEEVIKHEPQRLKHIDRLSFIRTLLRVLQTNPEDDKGDDYRLIKQANGREMLWRIDNERAFYTPTLETGRLSKQQALQVKSILYCLDQMLEPLNPEELEEIWLLNPLLVLEDIVQKAIHYHQYCQQLFTEQDVNTHFSHKTPGPSILTVMMAEDWIKEQWNRLYSIREVIKLAIKHNTLVTGLSLLEVVQPTLAAYYKKAFFEYPKDENQPQKALARFEAVTEGLYERTHRGHISKMPNIHAISQSLQLKVDLKAEEVVKIYRGEQLSPIQTYQKLDVLKNRNKELLLQVVLAGERGSARAFQSLSHRQQLVLIKSVTEKLQQDSQAYSLIAQQNLLKAMVGIPFHRLDVSVFANVITDDLLLPLLQQAGNHLLSLNLSHCQQLTVKILDKLVTLCPQLEVLTIENALVKEDASFFGTIEPLIWTGRFDQLRTLTLKGCQALSKLHIQSPSLTKLVIEDCEKLIEVCISPLHQLSIKRCVQLETIDLKPIILLSRNLSANKPLSQLLIHDCPAISRKGLTALLIDNLKLPELDLVNTANLKPASFAWLVNREKAWSVKHLERLIQDKTLVLANAHLSHALPPFPTPIAVAAVNLAGAYISPQALTSFLPSLPIDVVLKTTDYKVTSKERVLTTYNNVVWAFTMLDGTLYSGSGDYTIKRWDVAAKASLQSLKGHTGAVYALAVMPNGTLFSGSKDNTIKQWDPLTGKCIQTLTGHTDSVWTLALLPDNNTLVSGSWDTTIKCWNVMTGACIQTLTGHTSSVLTLNVLSDRNILVSGSGDHTIKCWDIATKVCFHTLKGHTGRVITLSMLHDGTLLSGSTDSTIKHWDPLTGVCLQTLTGHSDSVWSLTILPDNTFASSSLDCTIKHWDPLTGVCLQTLSGHGASVHALTLLPDGTLVSSSLDNNIRTYRFSKVTFDLSWRLYLGQGTWQVQGYQIHWQVEKGSTWLQMMATALAHLLNNRLIKCEMDMEKGIINWTIDIPTVDTNCPETVRVNYQNQTQAKAKKDLIDLLKALGAKLVITDEKDIGTSPKINFPANRARSSIASNQPPSVFFNPVALSATNTNNNNESKIPVIVSAPKPHS